MYQSVIDMTFEHTSAYARWAHMHRFLFGVTGPKILEKYTMYHGNHESFQGNLIMGGQCTFTNHQWQFSMHDRQKDIQKHRE